MGPLIAPARAGFAPADKSPLLVYTTCQAPAVSPHCTVGADTSGPAYRAPNPGSGGDFGPTAFLQHAGEVGGFFQGYSGASLPPLPPSPLAFPQPLSSPGLGMAELSPALESCFTATETAFPPLQSAIKPAASRPLNSQTGRFCPRPMHPQARRGDALRVASPPFISLQASLDQPASPPDRPSFLLGGKANSPATAHL